MKFYRRGVALLDRQGKRRPQGWYSTAPTVAPKEPRPNCNQAVLDVRCTKEGGKMMSILKLSLLAAIVPLCWGALVKTESPEKVPYPDGYRRWTHVRSGLTGPESPDYQLTGGPHHIYAKDKAMEGNGGGRCPDGSVSEIDLLKVQTKDGVTLEGERRYLTVMHKDSKRLADTGGWGFEVFLKDSRTDRTVWPNAKTKCYDCHVGQKDRDFVFGSFRK